MVPHFWLLKNTNCKIHHDQIFQEIQLHFDLIQATLFYHQLVQIELQTSKLVELVAI